MGDDEANFFVGDFGREGFLEGLEVVEAEFCGALADLFGVDGMDPVGAVGKFALLDEIGDEDDDGGEFAATELGDFLKGAALLKKLEGFLSGAGRACVPLLAGTFAGGEAAKGLEDSFAVSLALGVAHAGDGTELLQVFRSLGADVFQRGIVEDEKGGEHFFAGNVFAPLAEEFAKVFVHGDGRIALVDGTLEGERRV